MTPEDMKRLAIEECIEQFAITPHDYVGMGMAMERARILSEVIEIQKDYPYGFVLREEDILNLSHLVSGYSSYRRVPVTVGGKILGWETIEHDIEGWLGAYNEGRLTPDEAYLVFEEIHPFVDGNGRVGLLLWLIQTQFAEARRPDYSEIKERARAGDSPN